MSSYLSTAINSIIIMFQNLTVYSNVTLYEFIMFGIILSFAMYVLKKVK